MFDIYSAAMRTIIDKPVEQGRIVTTASMKWQAYVPTLAEFRSIIGTIFQSGIPTDAPAFTSRTFDVTKWFLTSTESTVTPGKFVAINANNQTRDVSPDEDVSIHLLFTNTLIV